MDVMDGDEQLQLDFEGVEAQDCDVASMSRLLNQLVKESGVDPESLAKVLVSQNYVGSVLKPCIDDVDFDDDEDPEDQAVYAITSVVNLTQRQDAVAKDILNFIKKRVRDDKVEVKKASDAFDKFIEDPAGPPTGLTLGLLVKERMVNMPVQLLHPSLLSLGSDINSAVRKNMPYKFSHLIYWAKMYVHEGDAVHCDVEDSWFDENSLGYFSYPLKHSDTVMVDSGDNATVGIPIRRIYIFEYSKLISFVEHLKEITGE